MTRYHPKEVITNNQATINTADLAYEAHGKCGCQTVILSDEQEEPYTAWYANEPQSMPSLPNEAECTDYSNVYKIVALSNTKFRDLQALNIADLQIKALLFGSGGFKLLAGHEIYANFTYVEILSGTVMLYRDCQQS
tara:strand:- start:1326 stop:1736 length:411 start_codon:yes stop_codon:yes gene_type:complete